MFGWSSDAASRDSVRNRSRKRSSSASSGERIFSATLPLEREIVGAVDDAHPAAAEQRLEPVAGELRPDARIEAQRAHGGGLPALQAGVSRVGGGSVGLKWPPKVCSTPSIRLSSEPSV